MLMRTPPSSLHSSLLQSSQVEAGNLAAIDPPPSSFFNAMVLKINAT